MQTLAKAGLSSQRGPHGGFSLMVDPNELTVFDVVEVIDPVRRIHTCPLGISDHGTNLCALHRLLDSTSLMIERQFRKVTIQSIIQQRVNESHPLCPFPTHRNPDPEDAVKRAAN